MTVELSCAHCRDHLIEFSAGSLPPAHAAAVHQHLTTCSACQHELAAWRRLTDVMGVRDQQTPLVSPARVASGWARLAAALPALAPSDARQDTVRDAASLREEPPAPPPITPPSPPWLPSPSSPIPPVPSARHSAVRLHDRLLPALAAVLVMTLGAALFGVLAHRAPPHPPAPVVQQPHPTCAPNQSSARLPKGNRLARLAMRSPDDGWAVGDTYVSGGGSAPSTATSLILHYSHCQWTPEPVQLPGVVFYRISAVSANNVWVWGFKLTATSPNAQQPRLTSLLMHYTGGQWQETPFPISVPDNQIIMGFSMVAADEGWILVAQRNDKNGFGQPYQLYHGVKGVWSEIAAPGYHNLWLVKAFAPGAAWLTAEQDTSSATSGATSSPPRVLLLYRDGTLTPLYTFPPNAFLAESGQIQMDGSQDAWVTVQTYTTRGAPSGWLLLHCSLSSCSQSSLLADPRIQASDHVQIFSATEGWAFLSNPPTASPQAAPQTDPQSSIFRLHSGQWQRLSTPVLIGPVNDVQQVAPDEYWIVTSAALLHFANGSWSEYS